MTHGPATPKPSGLRLAALALLAAVAGTAQAQATRGLRASDLLGITPSTESRDYVDGKRQFQLHTLLTEQRHPETMDLSRRIATDTVAGLEALFAVDRDVARTMVAVADDPARLAQLQQASQAMQRALREGRRVYFYGTGSTGRHSRRERRSRPRRSRARRLRWRSRPSRTIRG